MKPAENVPTQPMPPPKPEQKLEQGSGGWMQVADPTLSWENDRPHLCSLPALSPELPIGNGSLWGCACGKRYRVNRRGDVLNWVVAG